MRVVSCFPLIFALAACTVPGTGGDGEDEDDGGDGGAADGGSADGGSTTWEGCEETWIDYIGEDEPMVGDSWTVWLYCDDALLTGPTVIRFDPLDFATVQDNVVTWVRDGKGIMRVQTGAEWAELTVVVGEE